MRINQNRLKDLREDHDYTQQQVAEKIGITQRKYSYIETGVQQLTADVLVALARFLQGKRGLSAGRNGRDGPLPGK